MPRVADVQADVVQERAILEPLALAVGEPVDRSRLVEDREGQPGDVPGVVRPVAAALGQLDGAPPPDIGVPLGPRDLPPVAPDVVEDQPLPQGQIAQGQIGGAEPPDDRVQQHGAGHDQVGAPRIEAGKLEPLGDVEADHLLAEPVQLPGGDPEVAQFLRRPASGCGHRDSPEAENGAGRPDCAIESGSGDLVEITVDFRVNVPHELAFVAA